MILITTDDLYVVPQLFALPVLMVREQYQGGLVVAGEELHIHIKGLKGGLGSGGRSASFESAGDVYYQGLRLYKLKQYKHAISLLEEAVMMEPTFFPSRFSLCDARFEYECVEPTRNSSCVHDGHNWLTNGLSPELATELRSSLDELIHGNNNGLGNGQHRPLVRNSPVYENWCKLAKASGGGGGKGGGKGGGYKFNLKLMTNPPEARPKVHLVTIATKASGKHGDQLQLLKVCRFVRTLCCWVCRCVGV
jgi:hypothetical protein